MAWAGPRRGGGRDRDRAALRRAGRASASLPGTRPPVTAGRCATTSARIRWMRRSVTARPAGRPMVPRCSGRRSSTSTMSGSPPASRISHSIPPRWTGLAGLCRASCAARCAARRSPTRAAECGSPSPTLFDFGDPPEVPEAFMPTCHIFLPHARPGHRRWVTEMARPQGCPAGQMTAAAVWRLRFA